MHIIFYVHHLSLNPNVGLHNTHTHLRAAANAPSHI